MAAPTYARHAHGVGGRGRSTPPLGAAESCSVIIRLRPVMPYQAGCEQKKTSRGRGRSCGLTRVYGAEHIAQFPVTTIQGSKSPGAPIWRLRVANCVSSVTCLLYTSPSPRDS